MFTARFCLYLTGPPRACFNNNEEFKLTMGKSLSQVVVSRLDYLICVSFSPSTCFIYNLLLLLLILPFSLLFLLVCFTVGLGFVTKSMP